jgi:DNA-binding transcriptional MocR family regulator
MHAVVDVDAVNAERVHIEAMARGIESMPLSAYYSAAERAPNALLLGFGAVAPAAIRAGVNGLARVIEQKRRET